MGRDAVVFYPDMELLNFWKKTSRSVLVTMLASIVDTLASILVKQLASRAVTFTSNTVTLA